MTLSDHPARARIQAPDASQEHLPAPPADRLVAGYLEPRRRWVFILCIASFAPVPISIALLSSRSPVLWPLLAVACLSMFTVCVAASTGLRRSAVSEASHRRLVQSWLTGSLAKPTLQSVDVFLPTCGEDLEILRNTYLHVSALEWAGRVTVWVLDDADRPAVRELALTFGFTYVVRPDRGVMKKAGNLKHAFGLSEGDLIAVLDADFCPRPDYLYELVPYFDDAKVGIVQSPQYFSTDPSMSWLERGAGSTQEFFYRWIQSSRDRFDGAICVGTCALYRRRSLEAAGGFAQIEHSEDVHTGVAVTAAGGVVRYVPVIVSTGICPDQVGGFIAQQYRWCMGSMSMLRRSMKEDLGQNRGQKWCFLSGYLYYITTALTVITASLPPIIMLAFFNDHIKPMHLVPFVPAAWTVLALLPRTLTSRYRPDVLRVQVVYSFAHLVAISHATRNRAASWVPTGAAKGAGGIARPVCWIGSAIIAVSLTSLWALLILRLAQEGVENHWIMVLFALLQAYILVPVLGLFLRQLLSGTTEARRRLVRRDGGSPIPNQISGTDFVLRTVLLGCIAFWAASGTDPLTVLGAIPRVVLGA